MAKKQAKPKVRRGGPRSRERNAKEVEFLQRLGGKIKAARNAAEMTGNEVAQAMGLSLQTQYLRESGKQSGQWEDLYRYAVVLKCDVSDLLP